MWRPSADHDGQPRRYDLVNIDAFAACDGRYTFKPSQPFRHIGLDVFRFRSIHQHFSFGDGSGRRVRALNPHSLALISDELRLEGCFQICGSRDANGYQRVIQLRPLMYHQVDHAGDIAGKTDDLWRFGVRVVDFNRLEECGHGAIGARGDAWGSTHRLMVLCRARGAVGWFVDLPLGRQRTFVWGVIWTAIVLALLERVEDMRGALYYLIAGWMQGYAVPSRLIGPLNGPAARSRCRRSKRTRPGCATSRPDLVSVAMSAAGA